MAFTSIPAAGAKLTAATLAALINELRPVTASKAASTSRNTTTTPTADPDLVIALGVGTFDIIGDLLISSAADAAGDFQYRWAWTGTMTVTMGGVGPSNTLPSGATVSGDFVKQDPDATTPTATIGYGASVFAVNAPILARAVVTAAGTLTLEWSQLSSNASNTTLQAGSSITARQVA